MERSDVFDKEATMAERIQAERSLKELEIAHKQKTTKKKTIEDMMQQERVDNIKR